MQYFDYTRSHNIDEIISHYLEVSSSGQYILKKKCEALEDKLCSLTGRSHAIVTSSATMAMRMALSGLGIGCGDSVISPSLSYISTASVVIRSGADVRFCDSDETTFIASAENVLAAVGQNTRAAILPHLYRSACDLPSIIGPLEEQGIRVIEDAATALGGQYQDGTKIGKYGAVSVLSFFPAKPLGGLGDGGALLTDDDDIASLCRSLRNHGQNGIDRFVHYRFGFNARMDEWNAGYLVKKAEKLEGIVAQRRELLGVYDDLFAELSDAEVKLQKETAHGSVPYAYVGRFKAADRLETFLKKAGIATKRFPALHHHGAFRDHELAIPLPVTDMVSPDLIGLPFFPGMTRNECEQVVSLITRFYRGKV